MFYVITGGSGSGKSEYAENLILQLKSESEDARQEQNGVASRLIYLATMKPDGEETKKKIERHKLMRAGKGFETIECFGNLQEIHWKPDDIVLLECMSNLLADEMYSLGEANPVEKILEGVRQLAQETKHLVIVTNEVFSDGLYYDAETIRYIKNLGEINTKMAAVADEVTEVVYGIAVNLRN